MSRETWEKVAFQNMSIRLGGNPYPGRIVIVGMSADGKFAVQISGTMGRGNNSRNRVYECDGTRVFTEAADPSQMKPEDARNIIYTAMREERYRYMVSNGNQTDTAMDKFNVNAGQSLSEALSDRTYEDDEPNWTPRITGLCEIGNDICRAELHIIRKSGLTAELITHSDCQHFSFVYGQIIPGFGFCISTYTGDGSPLPSYDSVPFPVLVSGEIEDVATNYWQLLNPVNKVSLAVKFIELATGESQIVIKNKYAKVVSSTQPTA